MAGARTVAVLGATGSIGTQTLDVVRADPERYRVSALGASGSVARLAAQAREFRPEVVALADSSWAGELESLLPTGIEVLAGPDAMVDAALTADTVINGVVGFAGLPVTLGTLEAGLRLGLANKESLISAGPVVKRAWATSGAELIPVDSEHCAVHQCLRANESRDRVRSVVLTASGGPFRGWARADLEAVTVDEALAHPTWSMGPKITVDSSTLMNKGLEVIEAHELFDIDYDDIDVVVHPQSIVHSMVTFSDGATIAQLSLPDMRLCIGYALAYPDRLTQQFGAIDWTDLKRLDFEPPDRGAFRCLDLAFDAGRAGETAPAWLNAANEVVVAAFLDGHIRWVDIADILAASLDLWPGMAATGVDVVMECDRVAREATRRVIDDKVTV